MDLPREERALFLQWNLDTLAGADFTSEASLRAYGEMEDYWTELVVDRRAHRTNDLISQIIHTQVAGEDLSDAEISGFCSLLHNASQNTTMNMITNSVISLARHPDQRRKLIDNPERWPEALEELLRYESPVQGLARTASNDVTIDDVTIKAGDQVLLLYGSSNHDETVFERPDVLDFDREVKFHWTFGHGIHYCLGNAVARLETRVAIQVLLGTIPDFEIDESEIVRNQLVPTRGVAHAPISFEPGRRVDSADCGRRAGAGPGRSGGGCAAGACGDARRRPVPATRWRRREVDDVVGAISAAAGRIAGIRRGAGEFHARPDLLVGLLCAIGVGAHRVSLHAARRALPLKGTRHLQYRRDARNLDTRFWLGVLFPEPLISAGSSDVFEPADQPLIRGNRQPSSPDASISIGSRSADHAEVAAGVVDGVVHGVAEDLLGEHGQGAGDGRGHGQVVVFLGAQPAERVAQMHPEAPRLAPCCWSLRRGGSSPGRSTDEPAGIAASTISDGDGWRPRSQRWLPGTTRVAPLAAVKSTRAVMLAICSSGWGRGTWTQTSSSRCRNWAWAPGWRTIRWPRLSW